jgi:hypothetical protein
MHVWVRFIRLYKEFKKSVQKKSVLYPNELLLNDITLSYKMLLKLNCRFLKCYQYEVIIVASYTVTLYPVSFCSSWIFCLACSVADPVVCFFCFCFFGGSGSFSLTWIRIRTSLMLGLTSFFHAILGLPCKEAQKS